jgi:hypothetical protein
LLTVLPEQLNPLCLFAGLKTRVVELRDKDDHLVTRSRRVIKACFGGSK